MTNEEIQRAAIAARDAIPGIRVGDFVVLEGCAAPVRVSYIWSDRAQTADGGRFYLGTSGHADFSGALDPGIPLESLVLADDVLPGAFWHFDRGIPRAHSAVEYKAPCRVFRQI